MLANSNFRTRAKRSRQRRSLAQNCSLGGQSVPNFPRLVRPGSPVLRIGEEIDTWINLAVTNQSGRQVGRDCRWQFFADQGKKRFSVVPKRATEVTAVAECVSSDGNNGFHIFRRAAVERISKACGAPPGRGAFSRLCHGWYTCGVLTAGDLLRAICVVIPSDSVIAGETAGMLYGIRVQSPLRPFREPRVCVVRPRGRRALERPGIHCRVMQLEPDDVVNFDGIRVTSPLRTLVDLAMGSTIDVATHLVERFVGAGLVSECELRNRVDRLKGRRGVCVLRQAITLFDLKSESPLETAVRIRLVDFGLGDVQSQIPVWVPGRGAPYRLDLGWRTSRLGKGVGVEVHSTQYHPDSGPKAAQDQARESEIRSEGWELLIVRCEDLRGNEPTFESKIAELMGRSLIGVSRSRWRLGKWRRYRNSWTKGDMKSSRLYRESDDEPVSHEDDD